MTRSNADTATAKAVTAGLRRISRRISRRAIAACCIGVVGACATTHPENPALDTFPPSVSGSTEVVYYDIHGRTDRELVADMRRLGPKTAAGGIFFGETQSPMRWQYRIRPDAMQCTLYAVTVRVSSQITLPRWTPPADTVPGLYARWQAFLAALQVHEIGHKDLSGRAAAEIIHELNALNTSCSTLTNDVQRITERIVAQLRDDQVRYDAETHHGATQGAVFVVRRAPP